jgi:hypothetical protein
LKSGARIHLIYVEDELRKHVYNTNIKILEIEIYLRYLQRTNNNFFEITESLKDIVRQVRALFHGVHTLKIVTVKMKTRIPLL